MERQALLERAELHEPGRDRLQHWGEEFCPSRRVKLRVQEPSICRPLHHKTCVLPHSETPESCRTPPAPIFFLATPRLAPTPSSGSVCCLRGAGHAGSEALRDTYRSWAHPAGVPRSLRALPYNPCGACADTHSSATRRANMRTAEHEKLAPVNYPCDLRFATAQGW